MAGSVADGFETLDMSFGDVQLVDRDGAANLIKPLGLCFPLASVLVAAGLRRLGHGWQAATVLAAGLAWPAERPPDAKPPPRGDRRSTGGASHVEGAWRRPRGHE